MPKTISRKQKAVIYYPLIRHNNRLSLLESIRGMWKHRKPDPVKELERMRREREREIISR